MGVLYPFLPFFLLTFVCQEINGIELYIHIRGAFSVARFDKQGNAKASTRGTSDRTGSTFFLFVCIQSFLLTVKRELLAKKHLKMKKSFTMRCMLIALFTVMSMAANAEVIEYSTDDGFKYNLDTEAKTAELAKFSGSQKEVVIPENVTYNDVTYSLTSLGNYCFSRCSSLTSVTIPSSVTSLGDWCFEECTSLKSIDIPSSVTSLGEGCFRYCSSLTSIDIPSSVTSLGNSCFIYCKSLTFIDIPSSVTRLGSGCFSHCSSLESITVDKNNKVYDSRENCNAIIETSTNTMIQGCKTTVIPSSVTSLGERCFSGCSSLTSIDIPSSVTSLGHSCFENCSSLTSIDIPSSVTRLGHYCFYDCSSLTSIDIPSSVTFLGEVCFYNCSSLESITVDKNNKVYDSRENCNAIIETSTNRMMRGCKTTVIPSSVTRLGDYCFFGCSSLTSIDIPSSVTRLGWYCFSNCSSLTSVTIPSSVTSLGSGCFFRCESLTSIDIPSSVTSLGEDCFKNCTSLKTVTCEIATPINGDFFQRTHIDQATLYVLEASLDAYRTTSPWSGFGTILPITSVGINYNTANKKVTIDAVYDLDGKRSNGPSRGLNIIRMSDGTTRKVMK